MTETLGDAAVNREPEAQVPGGSRIIGRILPAAVRLWLRSQVEQVDQLSLQLTGRDRQILTGYVPGVAVSAERAVYQGLHVSAVGLTAADIRVNVGQVIRGRPLRLLQAFPVTGTLQVTDHDLAASLTSSLLSAGLKSFWLGLMRDRAIAQAVVKRYGQQLLQTDLVLHDLQLRLGQQRLGLSFHPQFQDAATSSAAERLTESAMQAVPQPVVLGVRLTVHHGNLLQLQAPRWLSSLDELDRSEKGVPIPELDGFQWNLGRDAQLDQLTIQPEQIMCQGQVMVNP